MKEGAQVTPDRISERPPRGGLFVRKQTSSCDILLTVAIDVVDGTRLHR